MFDTRPLDRDDRRGAAARVNKDDAPIGVYESGELIAVAVGEHAAADAQRIADALAGRASSDLWRVRRAFAALRESGINAQTVRSDDEVPSGHRQVLLCDVAMVFDRRGIQRPDTIFVTVDESDDVIPVVEALRAVGVRAEIPYDNTTVPIRRAPAADGV